MPIRYSSVVGGSASSGFNLDVGSSGDTTFEFDEPQPAGGYSITSQLADATIEFYAIAEDGTLAGYTNTKALAASQDFTKIVIYGATNNDLLTFEFKPTTLPTGNGDQDSGAAPFITSVSDADLASIDDTTIITGGNFATNVTVTFTGTDNIIRNAKSVVRTNSTQLIVTRPDDFLEDNSPYTLTISNPGIPQSAYQTYTSSITAGGGPVWTTAAGALPGALASQAYATTLEATDPDGGTISYALVGGSLPAGFSLDTNTGIISGATTTASATFTISATDTGGNSSNRSFSIVTTTAIGGIVTTDGQYIYHTFTANGTFESYSSVTADILVVAGGGGGGGVGGTGGYHAGGGGGGAGGLLTATATTIAPSSYSISVGAGGTTNSSAASQGTGSSAFGLAPTGGGRGFYGGYGTPASNGGSGGGAGRDDTTIGQGINGQGNNGGSHGGTNSGAGGGGAGAPGASDSGLIAGGGGNGLQWLDGNYYAGGGGGGNGNTMSSADFASGGLGGGGNGSPFATRTTPIASNFGQDNTGGGGGGGGAYTNAIGVTGASGGSGIVIIRYPA